MQIKRNFYGSTIKDNGRQFFYDHRLTKFNGFFSFVKNYPKESKKRRIMRIKRNFYGSTIKDNGRQFFLRPQIYQI